MVKRAALPLVLLLTLTQFACVADWVQAPDFKDARVESSTVTRLAGQVAQSWSEDGRPPVVVRAARVKTGDRGAEAHVQLAETRSADALGFMNDFASLASTLTRRLFDNPDVDRVVVSLAIEAEAPAALTAQWDRADFMRLERERKDNAQDPIPWPALLASSSGYTFHDRLLFEEVMGSAPNLPMSTD